MDFLFRITVILALAAALFSAPPCTAAEAAPTGGQIEAMLAATRSATGSVHVRESGTYWLKLPYLARIVNHLRKPLPQ